jgi:hypothetical protein
MPRPDSDGATTFAQPACEDRAAGSRVRQLTRYLAQRPRVRAALPPRVVPLQFRKSEAADLPAPCFARLRHVVNNRDVS